MGPESAPTSRPDSLSLSLEDAVGFAVRNNLTLKIALIDEQIAETRIRQELGVYDPTFFANVTTSKREQLFAGVFPDPTNPLISRTFFINNADEGFSAESGVRGRLSTGGTYEASVGTDYRYQQSGGALNPIFTTTGRLQLTQPLLRNAWMAYNDGSIEIAKNRRMQSREEYRSSMLGKIREVQTAYFDLVFARENLQVKRNSLVVADQQVEVNRVKVDAGALPPVEMTSAESARAFRRSEVVTAEAQVVEAEDRLRREIFAFETTSEWTVHLEPTETLSESEIQIRPLDELLQTAFRTEPRIVKAHLDVARAGTELDMRRSERLPKLDASASVNVNSLGSDAGQTYADVLNRARDALSVSGGLALEVPLGNRAASAREAEAELTVTRAQVVLRNLETDVGYGVRNSVRNIDVALRTIRARREAVRFAEQQLANERAKFEVQASTNFQVFEVEDQVNQRRTELIRSMLDYRLAVLDLPRVTGAPLAELVVK